MVGDIIHINDLRTSFSTSLNQSRRYVDNASLWEFCSPSAYDSHLQLTANEAVQWSNNNLMTVNCDKTKALLVLHGRKAPDIPPIKIGGKPIEKVTITKLLGGQLQQ